MAAITHTARLENRISTINRKNRETTEAIEHAVLHKASVTATALVFGVLARNEVSPEIKGVPWKLPLWLITQTIEAMAPGAFATIAGGMADAALAVYTANAVATSNWVAGEAPQSGNL